MTTQIFTTSQTASGVLANLGDDGNVFVAEGITVGSTNGIAVYGTGSYHHYNIQGIVVADLIALYAGDGLGDTHNQILIGENGYVTSMNHDSIAVATLSDSSVIDNRGAISAEETAVTLGGIATGTKSTLINSGLIEAGTSTILVQGTEDVYLRNSGVIRSDSSAYDGHQNVDVITNNGQIWGNISLSDGEDKYTGTAGHLHGEVHGGSGADILTMGADNDLIYGEEGNDVLTGGAGKDSFIFNTVLDASANVDKIKDYVVRDDTIDLDQGIFGLRPTGTLSSSAFVANNTGTAGDASDRIIYETDTGKLYYDHDGKGGDAAILFAVLSKNLAMTSAEFHIV